MSYTVIVTGYGNIAVVGPAVIFCWLWLVRHWGDAASWHFLYPVALGFAATVALKLVSRRVGGSLERADCFLSAWKRSGSHVEMISAAYGGLAIVLLRRSRQPLCLLAAGLIALLLTGVAITCVTLHAHTPAAVLVGLAIGSAAAPNALSRHVAELVGLLICVTLVIQLSRLRIDNAKII